ncbi:hypothetical protein [Pseudomonas sp. 9AZ]|uniref:hypothetical protein n=1 Tax=Pseudomonas sp. 9AZ TaxID=2653168 RepID=UPI0013568272|nr:hypothetical protein [Pseudomonas sp. 9AZ]
MDKNYFTAPTSLPPQHIRAILSDLSNAALAYKATPLDSCDIFALLNKLLLDHYYQNQLNSDTKINSAKLINLIKNDLANTCHWWEESWRFQASWQTIEEIYLKFTS